MLTRSSSSISQSLSHRRRDLHLQQRKKERKTDTFGHLLATLQISNYREEWYVFIQITYVYVRLSMSLQRLAFTIRHAGMLNYFQHVLLYFST